MLKSINSFISLFLDTFKLFGRVKAWLLLLIISLSYWLLLYGHNDFANPMFYSAVTWWTELWDAQYAGGFTHYPGHYILLSYYYSSAKLFIGLLLEGGILGAVALVFYRHIFITETNKAKLSLGSFLTNWFNLSLCWGLLNGILFLGYKFLPMILSDFLWSSPRRQMIFDYGLIPFFNILVVALFFFAIPYIAIYRTNVLAGLSYSFKTFFKRPIFTLFLASAVLAAPLILALIMNDPSTLVSKFNPIIVYWLLLVGIVIDLFVNFFWIGTAVNYLSEDD